VRHSKTVRWMKVAFLAVVVLTAAGAIFHVAGTASAASSHVALGNRPEPAAHPALSATSVSMPLFFEPNQGQTDPQVKFLARGTGYGLFLTSNEAVLDLERPASKGQPAAGSVVRMHLDGANSAARVQGAEPLPGKSGYFIGNDSSKWRQDVPHFARVEYQDVYPGINLVYYGNQGQLEYDFRVAPGAEPKQIALTFNGASAHLESGDLVLSTHGGDLRFHAPHIYQRIGSSENVIPGSFRQLAENKIGFEIGAYDHSKELVIDPLLSYSSYLGGSGLESFVKIAVGADFAMYVAGSTTSTNFPTTAGAIQSTLLGTQNIFISKFNPSLAQPQQLIYSTYLGSSGTDNLAGVAVDPNNGSPNIYVAGTTNAIDFPTTSNGFQPAPEEAGTHGFLSKLSPSAGVFALSYSTYLSGNGTDSVTGLAVDNIQNAYLTGITNSTDDQSNGFPANPNGFQRVSNSPGNNQFFASKLSTTSSGPQSMVYSTYFGGGNPAGALTFGGGIAVDASGNMYFSGGTNMLGVDGTSGPKFPLFNSYQSCLDESGKTTCTLTNPTAPDAFLVKINPSTSQPQAPPVYSTYLGGSANDIGTAVSVDTSSNAYVTGSTNSPDWLCSSPCVGGPYGYLGAGQNNAFIAKVGNQLAGSNVFPLNFFTYLGGSGPDVGQAIVADSVGGVHLTGSTASPNLPITTDSLQLYGGNGDAFVALISSSNAATGNYVTYLGGSQLDQGSGIALDLNGATYVAGTTVSSNFPLSATPYQGGLSGSQDAFMTKIGANSTINITAPTDSPTPNPVPAGSPVTFIFDLTNGPPGTDPATNITFYATVPSSGIASNPTAKVTTGGGNCGAVQGATIVCNIGSLAVGGVATVQVTVTPSIPIVTPQITVTGAASANGGPVGAPFTQPVANIVDFSMSASPNTLTINAGDTASFPITLTPNPSPYNATITMSETTSPSIVTATTPTFTNSTVTLSGSSTGTTTLNIATVARPVTSGSLLRKTSFYAAWLPIGGLSLVGLGLGAGRKRRRWFAGIVLGLLAAMILLQAGCGSSSSGVTQNGGTAAGRYTITITGSAGTGASHNTIVILNVN